MLFNTENEMSEVFESFANSNLIDGDEVFLLKEFKGLFGIPDFILIENSDNYINYIVSIELKLKNWKRALKQAFRYRAFSNESYVILDEYHIELGLKNLEYFKKFNIGLGSFNSKSELKLFYKPVTAKPFSTKFNSILEKQVLNNKSADNSVITWNNFFIDENRVTNISLYSKFLSFNSPIGRA